MPQVYPDYSPCTYRSYLALKVRPVPIAGFGDYLFFEPFPIGRLLAVGIAILGVWPLVDYRRPATMFADHSDSSSK